MVDLGLATECDVIVQIEQIESSQDVGAQFVDPNDFTQRTFLSLHAVRHAGLRVGRPLGNFPRRRFVARMFADSLKIISSAYFLLLFPHH